MSMVFAWYGVACVCIGLVAAAFSPKGRLTQWAAALMAGGACLCLGLALKTARWIDHGTVTKLFNWQAPFATMTTGVDSLSLFFLIPLLVLAISAALYGPRYMDRHHAPRLHWLFEAALVAGMIGVLLARNAVLFILAWEIMSLSSFFLVITDADKEKTVRAGWIYFVTAHVGTAFLLTLFLLMSSRAGSFEFSGWAAVRLSPHAADLAFLLALVAFGMKAGFIPFHVWLPLAHPAAPSHVSSLMSGIMIKMGIYGILRILTMIGPYHAWWGIVLVVIGVVSGVLGVLFAIGQHDIKRLLAYHSVENIGIILLGIGLGIAAAAFGNRTIAALAMAGGLFHVLNHALFKGLLFMAAGSVIRQTGTGEIDRLGGLIKTMPQTAALFLIGSTAICGLPFFNGFISELMIYTAGIHGAVSAVRPALSILCVTVILSLALIGGLAVACFTKVFGIVFLGEPRSDAARGVTESPWQMRAAMWLPAGLCVALGLASPLVLPYLVRPVEQCLGPGYDAAGIGALYSLPRTVSYVLGACVGAGLLGLLAFTACFRSRRSAARTVTWGCGYSRPDPSMQYTASSYAAPIVESFKVPLALRTEQRHDTDYFPTSRWGFHSTVDDWFLSRVYTPVVVFVSRLFLRMRWFQNGKSGQYVLYIALTVLCLILWKFFI